jgi:trigger factor
VLPDVTDEWANEVSEFDTVDELRADFATRISGVRKMQAAVALRERVGEALAGLVEDDAPQPLVDEVVRERLQDLAMRLSAQGVDASTWLQAMGKSEAELVEELRVGAVDAVKVDLGLRAVADAEAIECTEDDLELEYERVAERIGEKPARVRREFERNDQVAAVRSDIRKRKALDWLIEHVEIVDESGEPIDRADLEIGGADGSADAEEVDADTGAVEDTEENAE